MGHPGPDRLALDVTRQVPATEVIPVESELNRSAM
jgi:hypothetical protein